VFLRIVDELAAHEAAEHEVVFPAFRAALAASDDGALDSRLGEHEELNELLDEMRGLAPDGFAFTKRGSALLLECKAHFQLEEESVFARMPEMFTADELLDMGRRAAAVKERSPAFPTAHR
jgi:hypothetical protein